MFWKKYLVNVHTRVHNARKVRKHMNFVMHIVITFFYCALQEGPEIFSLISFLIYNGINFA